MANTPFLNLVKPTDTDQALITDINNNSDKIDTGVSTLSEQIGTYEIPTNTIANIEAALATYASGLTNNEIRTVKFTVSTATTVFNASSYMGTLRKVATGRYNILTQGFLEESKLVTGNYRNSTWTWETLALDSQLGTCENLGNFTTQAALETALNTVVSGMGTNTNKAIQIACTGAFSVFPSGVTYNAMITKGGESNNYASVLFQSISGTAAPIIKATKNQSWRFEQLTTNAESVSFKTGITDANTFIPGIYLMGSNGTNIPEAATGYLVVFSGYYNYAFQLFCTTNTKHLYFRSADNNNWKTWTQIGA